MSRAWAIFLLIIMLGEVNTLHISVQENSFEYNVIYNTFSHLNHYSHIVYFDNKTVDYLDFMLKNSTTKFYLAMSLLNVDMNGSFIRSANSYVHVILLMDLDYLNNVTFGNLDAKDLVIVFTSASNEMSLCSIRRFFIRNAIFVQNSKTGDIVQCLYSLDQHTLPYRRIRKSEANMLGNYMEDLTNLHGMTYRVGYSQQPPLFYKG